MQLEVQKLAIEYKVNPMRQLVALMRGSLSICICNGDVNHIDCANGHLVKRWKADSSCACYMVQVLSIYELYAAC